MAVTLALAVASAMVVVPARANDLVTFKPGDSKFWQGAYVDTRVTGEKTFTYGLKTTDDGYRLRVALDLLLDYRVDGSEHEFADQGRRFEVALLRGGEEILSGSNADNGWGYSVELFVCFVAGAGCDPRPHGVPCTGVEPACDEVGKPLGCDATTCQPAFTRLAEGSSAGTWTIAVTAEDVQGWEFRMRVGLERTPSPPDQLADRVLSPNLRALPPFELTLDCVSVQGSGAGARAGVCGPKAGSEGFTGCTALEHAHNPGVTRCLRFSGGEEVAGVPDGRRADGGGGNLEILRRDETVDRVTGDVTARAIQVRRAPDGTIDERDAGRLVFHKAHGHWHYAGFMRYELLRVTGDTSTDAPPPMKFIHDEDVFGSKAGWAPADERMADWLRFNQGIKENRLDVLHQTVGWGDFYEWPVEEQFVPIATIDRPFSTGFYLLRETIDHGGLLRESNENDNTSYAYFEVTDARSLHIIERGYGLHPWDPRKVIQG